MSHVLRQSRMSALRGGVGLITAAGTLLFLFPFLFFQVIVLIRHPTMLGAGGLLVLFGLAVCVFGICQLWGSRSAGFVALHDYLYRFRGAVLTEHSVEDYVTDGRGEAVLANLYHPADLRREVTRRVHRIRIFYVREPANRYRKTANPSTNPIAYINPATLGSSFIFLRVPPGKVRGAGWFNLLHELGHAEYRGHPLHLHDLLGQAPYWLTVAAVLTQAQWNPASICLIAALGFTTLRLGNARQNLRVGRRLMDEIAADAFACSFLMADERRAIAGLLERVPGAYEDDLIPGPLRAWRPAVLRENLRRVDDGRPLVRAEWWNFFPWRMQALLFVLLGIAGLMAPAVGIKSIALLSLALLLPAVLWLMLVIRSHRHIQQEVEDHLRFSSLMGGMLEIIDSADANDSAEINEAEENSSLDDHEAADTWSYAEPAIYQLLDLLSRFGVPGLRGFRVSRWVNMPLHVARREIQGTAWTATTAELRAMRDAFEGAMMMERKPEKVRRLAECWSWYEMTSVIEGAGIDDLLQRADATGLPAEFQERARTQATQLLMSSADKRPQLLRILSTQTEPESHLLEIALLAAGRHTVVTAERAHLHELLTAVKMARIKNLMPLQTRVHG